MSTCHDYITSYQLYPLSSYPFSFFFNDTPTTEIYTLSLHDALPIWSTLPKSRARASRSARSASPSAPRPSKYSSWRRSEEHTSELQSHVNLVCRLLLEKKKKQI